LLILLIAILKAHRYIYYVQKQMFNGIPEERTKASKKNILAGSSYVSGSNPLPLPTQGVTQKPND
jgi:hypothetical protein